MARHRVRGRHSRDFHGAAAALLLGAVAAVAMTAAPPAGADEPSAEPTAFGESIDVELVNVDVWVTDRNGEPVRGLGADAFRVTQGGEPVEPTYFVELGPGDAAPGDTTPSPDDAGPPARPEGDYLVVYLDQLRLETRDVAAVLDGLRPLLEDPALRPEHVLVLRQNRGLFVEAHLGSSRADLVAAVDRLAGAGADWLQAGAELDQALEELRREWRESQDLAGARGNAFNSIPTGAGQGDGARGALGGGGGGFGPDACDLFTQRAGATVDGWARSQARRTAISLDFLSRTATFLAGLPGVKTVLYVSGGLETRPGAALADYVTGLCPGGEALFSLDGLGEEMSSAFFELTRHFNSNRVTVYPFKTGVLRASGAGSAAATGSAGATDTFRARGSFEQRRRSQSEVGLGVLADETGGRVLTRGDLLAVLARRLASRYSLAFEPPPGARGERRLDVQVDIEPGEAGGAPAGPVQVRYRRSFLDKSPDQRLAERVDGALFLGLVENALDLRLGAGELRPDGDARWTVPLRVQVPAASLTFDPTASEPATTLAVRVVGRHLESGALETVERAFRIEKPAGEIAAGSRVQLPIDLALDAGPCAIAVGLREETSKAVSVVSTALVVGPP